MCDPECATAQPKGYLYDEAQVPQYDLPNPLVMADGTAVADADTWRDARRDEVLNLFREHVYGFTPTEPVDMTFDVFDNSDNALDGTAIRKQVNVKFSADPNGPEMDILIYLPKNASGPVPCFLSLNFWGNHSISDDPAIKISNGWMRKSNDHGLIDGKATEKSRGLSSSRWPLKEIVNRGYGVATIFCNEIDPDFDDQDKNGVHSLFLQEGVAAKPNAWGTIGAWSWGLSRAVDYLETDPDVDAKKVILMGHSRLGKTALWGGAQDERFAIVISNNSGCGGAALSRRGYGETVKRINTSFPHWFCDNFQKYNDNETAIPVDQHMLVALIAPRPCYIASAVEDKWADPRGEFLSGKHASPVYELLGKVGMPAEEMPAVDQPVQGTIGYHVRTGGHDVKLFDWTQYMNFADKHFASK